MRRIRKQKGVGMIQWHKEKRKIKDLILNEDNPRVLSKKNQENLNQSIKKFGLCQPIQINTDNCVIGGHQRLSILKDSQKEVDVYVPTRKLSKKEVDELSIMLNKAIGNWDFDLLVDKYNEDDLISWGFEDKDFLQTKEREKESFDADGNPIAVDAWRDDIVGKGGFLDIPTNQELTSIGFVRDNLIMYCERSTWKLSYTGNKVQPFQIERVNSELGAE